MVNAALVAMEINSMLPSCDIPARTEMYEGFFHLTSMEGTVEKAKLHYIVRDHDKGSFEARKKLLRFIEKTMNEKYGAGTAVLTLKDEYENMEEKVRPCLHLIENAKASMRELGIEPDVSPVRGGTDGARLSFMGLPCPNLCAGGQLGHGRHEFVSVQSMDTIVEILKNLVRLFSE